MHFLYEADGYAKGNPVLAYSIYEAYSCARSQSSASSWPSRWPLGRMFLLQGKFDEPSWNLIAHPGARSTSRAGGAYYGVGRGYLRSDYENALRYPNIAQTRFPRWATCASTATACVP